MSTDELSPPTARPPELRDRPRTPLLRRPWVVPLALVVLFAVFVLELFTGAEVDTAALQQAVGVSTWISWVVNLLIVQWWLDRHPRPAELVP
jgi:hypothetical protein